MLVLTRLTGETLQLFVGGVEITVKICQVKGPQVRVGVEAPREVKVVRGELDYRPGDVIDRTA